MIFKKKPKQKPKLVIPTSITGSIPYECVYENGLIEVRSGVFSKSYAIPSLNFLTATDDAQCRLAEVYAEFLNTFEVGVTVQITAYNTKADLESLQEQLYVPYRGDGYDKYREELNEKRIGPKIRNSRNGLETKKVLTVTLEAIDVMAASARFEQMDAIISEYMSAMLGQATIDDTPSLTILERLDILNQIYNQENAKPLYRTRVLDGRVSESFTLANCVAQGITTKEIIAPESMAFRTNHVEFGDCIAKAFYVAAYPTYIKGTIFTDFSKISANMITSVYFTPTDSNESLRMVRNNLVNIKAEIIGAKKDAARQHIFSDELSVPTRLRDAQTDGEALVEVLTKDNARLFEVTFLFVLFAKNEDEMKEHEEQFRYIANKHLLTVHALRDQQEAGVNAALPIGNNTLRVSRIMSTQSIASIIPFDMKDIHHKGGMYYAQNAISKDMIVYNRLAGVNCNSAILGTSGVGKSFFAKSEMINVFLGTNDFIMVVDPDREYVKLARAFGGTVIKIAPGSNVYINPFDINIENTEDGSDPVEEKASFIEAMCETMIGGTSGLNSIQKALIRLCVKSIYTPHIEYLNRNGLVQDVNNAPVMRDFCNALRRFPARENGITAQNLAFSLEKYCDGCFGRRTNVDIQNRFIVYDIKDIGRDLEEVGLQITLDNIWNQMIKNKEKKLHTWIYVDEFYMLMKRASSAAYTAMIWKRARKWMGVPCAITQNIEDLLKSEDARAIINTSSFLCLLGQEAMNVDQLCRLLNISPTERKHIATRQRGRGLYRIGDDLIPMEDSFPEDTKLYQLMSTDPMEASGE